MEKQIDKSSEREIWIDVLRMIACISVVLIHSSAKYDGFIPGQFILAPANYILMATGVSIFFMISGALLLSKEQELQMFYKKRFTRILAPTLIWSVFYIIYEQIYHHSFTWQNTLSKISMIPFVNQTGILWFMYVLIGIYLVIPILSSWLNKASRKDIEMVLCLWGITLLMPIFTLYNETCKFLISEGGALYLFNGFIGYALLGYYLRKYVHWSVRNTRFIILFLFSIITPLIIFFTSFIPLSLLNGSMNIPTVCLSATCFIFFKSLSYSNGKILKIARYISKYSFGIYLSHWVFMLPLKYILTQYHINYLIQIPVTACFVFLISLFFVVLLSKCPYSKLLFG